MISSFGHAPLIHMTVPSMHLCMHRGQYGPGSASPSSSVVIVRRCDAVRMADVWSDVRHLYPSGCLLLASRVAMTNSSSKGSGMSKPDGGAE